MSTCITEMKRLRKEEVEDKNPNEPKVWFTRLLWLDAAHLETI